MISFRLTSVIFKEGKKMGVNSMEVSDVFLFVVSYLIAGTSSQKSIGARREQVPVSMAIENGELMHECFPKRLAHGNSKI